MSGERLYVVSADQMMKWPCRDDWAWRRKPNACEHLASIGMNPCVGCLGNGMRVHQSAIEVEEARTYVVNGNRSLALHDDEELLYRPRVALGGAE